MAVLKTGYARNSASGKRGRYMLSIKNIIYNSIDWAWNFHWAQWTEWMFGQARLERIAVHSVDDPWLVDGWRH